MCLALGRVWIRNEPSSSLTVDIWFFKNWQGQSAIVYSFMKRMILNESMNKSTIIKDHPDKGIAWMLSTITVAVVVAVAKSEGPAL